MTPERWQQVKGLLQSVLEQPTEDQTAFLNHAAGGDDPLRLEVESLLEFQEGNENFIETSALEITARSVGAEAQDEMTGAQIGTFQVEREIGRGGMGAVYLARQNDNHYQRQVAIKIIKRGMDSDEIVRRFRNERQILANLTHPNIAGLYSGGTTDAGLPFFVMEYVDGKPINEYCDARDLSIEDRLKLFRTVCSAISYAHQNLVIHRDLKPSNILVTDDGVPKLLDFGIAKVLKPDDEAALTETMLRVMTPEYASPEQARGERMTTASDVYSLGVVLYELLTGQRPYRLKNRLPHEIAQIISERVPERPSTAISRAEETPEGRSPESTTPSTGNARTSELAKRRRSLRGDLDNIVLMAMRKDPARRYQSVEQFSDDIHRHLEKLPVRARKDTFDYRASKFVQRNKLRVAAAAIICVTLIAGVVATIREARIARAERARAERRFKDVRNLANSFIFEFDTELESLPGSTKARSLLVERAKGYLDSLAQEASGDGLLQQELASAYLKIGDLQGRPYRFNLGQTGEALASYQKAVAILEPLRHSGLPNLKLDSDLATAYERIGTIQNRAGEEEASLENGHKALEMRKALLVLDPSNVNYRRQLADSYLYSGDSLSNGPYAGTPVERVRAALASQQKALDMRLELAQEFPADAQTERDVAQAYTRVGFRLNGLGQLTSEKDYFQQSLESQRKALAIRIKMTVLHPDDARDRRNLGDQYMLLSEAQMANNDPAGALDGLYKSLAIFKKATEADPSNAEARRDTSFVLDKIGIAQTRVGNLSSAETYLREAFQIADQLNAADPTNFEDVGTMEDSGSRLSELRARSGDFVGAIEELKRIASLYEKESTAFPAHIRFRSNLAGTYASLGKACVRYASAQGESAARQLQYWREARGWYQRSLNIWEDLRNTHALKESEVDKPEEVAHEIAKCDAAISSYPANRSRN